MSQAHSVSLTSGSHKPSPQRNLYLWQSQAKPTASAQAKPNYCYGIGLPLSSRDTLSQGKSTGATSKEQTHTHLWGANLQHKHAPPQFQCTIQHIRRGKSPAYPHSKVQKRRAHFWGADFQRGQAVVLNACYAAIVQVHQAIGAICCASCIKPMRLSSRASMDRQKYVGIVLLASTRLGALCEWIKQ
eukprot:1156014-Pelagomonas_calceolata.AAC.14